MFKPVYLAEAPFFQQGNILRKSLSHITANHIASFHQGEGFLDVLDPEISSALEHGANNAQVVGSVPEWAIHLRVGLEDLSGSLPIQYLL